MPEKKKQSKEKKRVNSDEVFINIEINGLPAQCVSKRLMLRLNFYIPCVHCSHDQ